MTQNEIRTALGKLLSHNSFTKYRLAQMLCISEATVEEEIGSLSQFLEIECVDERYRIIGVKFGVDPCIIQ